MYESLCYAVVGMGVVAAVALCGAISLGLRLSALGRERDRLARENATLQRWLDGGLSGALSGARVVNEELDRLANDLAARLAAREGAARPPC